jgi:8-oxo-dGTP diphosphatase
MVEVHMQRSYNMRVGASAVIIRDDHLLVVEFGAGWKRHFNLPGGGIESGESIVEGLQREVHEETGASITVGNLLFVSEYFPPHAQHHDGALHKLLLIFRCYLQPESEPHLPHDPDSHQVAIQWVRLQDLPNQPLIPQIGTQLLTSIAAPAPYDLFHKRI